MGYKSACKIQAPVKAPLIYTRRYSPLRGLTSRSCGGLWPRPRIFLRAKKELFTLFVFILGLFWYSVVTSIAFRGCSEIMAAKNGGVQTRPPPFVSHCQHFLNPFSPLHQPLSALPQPLLPSLSAMSAFA